MKTIRELRKSRGMTQKELAEKIGVAAPTISAWERGAMRISLPKRKDLLDFFGVDEIDFKSADKDEKKSSKAADATKKAAAKAQKSENKSEEKAEQNKAEEPSEKSDWRKEAEEFASFAANHKPDFLENNQRQKAQNKADDEIEEYNYFDMAKKSAAEEDMLADAKESSDNFAEQKSEKADDNVNDDFKAMPSIMQSLSIYAAEGDIQDSDLNHVELIAEEFSEDLEAYHDVLYQDDESARNFSIFHRRYLAGNALYRQLLEEGDFRNFIADLFEGRREMPLDIDPFLLLTIEKLYVISEMLQDGEISERDFEDIKREIIASCKQKH